MLGVSLLIMVLLSTASIFLTAVTFVKMARTDDQGEASETKSLTLWSGMNMPRVILTVLMALISVLSLMMTILLHWLSSQPHIFG